MPRKTAVPAAALAATLLVSLLAGPPVDATPRRALALGKPVIVGTSAQLNGRVASATRRVVLQTRQQGHWRKVRALKVRHHRFRTALPLLDSAQKVRVRAGRMHSRSRTIPAIPGPSDACGPQPLKADGTRWSCTFDDDFNGTQLDRSKWWVQTVFATGNALGAYACYDDDPSVVSVSGGALHLRVRKNPTPLPCANGLPPTPYRAGTVSTYHLFSQQYGRFEARYRNTATDQPGLQESWWLWPDDREGILASWPLAGEIDVAETYSQYPGLAIPFLHYTVDDNGGPIPGLNTSWSCAAQRGVYNTYTLVWAPDVLQAYVNGVPCLVNTSGDPAFRKKYILALTMALGTGSNGYTGTAPMPATMDVDYVRAWQ
jgi:beta-glucanase (GH16 family)